MSNGHFTMLRIQKKFQLIIIRNFVRKNTNKYILSIV